MLNFLEAFLFLSAAVAIPDDEPQVTTEVAQVLGQIADSHVPQDKFTERGLGMANDAQLVPLLRTCGKPPALVLLSRSVRGEDRQYAYRAECKPQTLTIRVDYNKASRINRLEITPDS